jgi:hypothetical protein
MAIKTKKRDPKKPKVLKIQQDSYQQAGKDWFLMDGEEAAACINANIEHWITFQRWRVNEFRRFARLYMNMPAQGGWQNASSRIHSNPVSSDRLSFNVCQSCVDTLGSKISKNKIRPQYVSNGGDYSDRRTSEQLNMFSDGVMYRCETHKIARDAFKWALIWGECYVWTNHEDGELHQQKLTPMDVWVDEAEAHLSGTTTQMHMTRQIDRRRAMALFPDAQHILENAVQVDPQEFTGNNLSDLVTLLYSWKLPSSRDAGDGRFLVTCDGKVVQDKEWKRMSYPLRRYVFCERPIGWFGQGLIEQIEGLQREINMLLWAVKEALRLGTGFRWWVQSGSKVVIDHLDNEIGGVLRSEVKPEGLMTTLIQPEVYDRIKQCIQDAYQQSGISVMNATAQKPAGLDSEPSIRAFNDIATERFMTVGQDYEDFVLGLSKDLIYEMQDMTEEGTSSYEVSVPNGQSVEIIDWKDIKVKDIDGFRVQCFPTSALPQDISGRLSTIQDMAQAGLNLDQDTTFDLLDFPDIKRIENLFTAERKWITKRLDMIVNDGDYTSPTEMDNLPLAVRYGKMYLARGYDQNLPEARVRLLIRWLSECAALINDQNPPPPPAAPAAMTPPANPAPAPVSPFVPNGNAPGPAQAA